MEILTQAPPDVMNHNLETVPRLYKRVRPGGDYAHSLRLLKAFKARHPRVPTKSGLMVRLGESDEEIVAQLVQVRGIGRWTVEMLLIFRLGRPDVLPVSDLGVRKGFQLTYRKRELPDAAALFRAGERWRPYRSVASWYLWRACDLEKKGELP